MPGLFLLGLLGGVVEWLADYDGISPSLGLMLAAAWICNVWVMPALGREIRIYRDLRE